MKTPGDVYRCSPRRLEDVKPYVYPAGYERRRVSEDGCIHFRGECVDLSKALGKMEVGLQRVSENHWRVWFRDLAVSGLESKNGRFRRCSAAENLPPGDADCNPCPDNKV